MIIQILANSLIVGATYAIVGVSFAVIFMPTRFFNFAHGAIYTLGAYGTLVALRRFHFVWPIAVVGGMAACVSVGLALEFLIYRRLRNRAASPLVLLLASLGLYVIIQNGISLAFGDYIQSIHIGPNKSFDLIGARVTLAQILVVLVGVVATVFAGVVLVHTRTGKAVRAIAGDATLARISGIQVERVILVTSAAGSAMAGLGGILFSLDYGITPTMGLNVLMMGIVAVVVGGVKNIPGIALAAIVTAMAQNFGALLIGSQWQDAIAFFVLVLYLLLRPVGVFGRITRSTTV